MSENILTVPQILDRIEQLIERLADERSIRPELSELADWIDELRLAWAEEHPDA